MFTFTDFTFLVAMGTVAKQTRKITILRHFFNVPQPAIVFILITIEAYDDAKDLVSQKTRFSCLLFSVILVANRQW